MLFYCVVHLERFSSHPDVYSRVWPDYSAIFEQIPDSRCGYHFVLHPCADDICRSGGALPKRLSLVLDSLERIPRCTLVPNPFREPPEAVVAGGAESIKRYFTDLFADRRTTERCDMKAVIIGQAGAGKTR